MGFFLASLLWAMEIHAPGACPSSAAIGRQLTPLLGEGELAGLADVARLVRAPDGALVLELADPEGKSLGERRFPRRSCQDEAETVAVTLAIWEAQIHPEISLRLDRLAPAVRAPAAEAPLTASSATEPLNARASLPLSWSLGVAAVADRQAGEWVPGGRIELGVGPQARRWRVRVALLGTARHRNALLTGQARWWRAAAAAGVAVDLIEARHAAVELGGAGLLGLVVASGLGFGSDESSRSLDFGAEAWLRGRWKAGRVSLWGGPALVGWARRQALDVAGETTSTALPHLAVTLAFGLDFVW